jgi:hypothetical protein
MLDITHLVVLSSLTLAAWSITIEPNSTLSEGLSDPFGISTLTPRLSWRLQSSIRNDSQTAYQIQVSTSNTISDFTADLWDSGKTHSTNISATYFGQTLDSRSIGYWRVRAWDSLDEPSLWSQVSSFELGLLSSSDWDATWIGNTQYQMGKTSLPLFAKSFDVACPSIVKARLYLTGLGQHSASLNGVQISNDVLAPGYSNTNKTIFYSTYDATSNTDSGNNVLGIELGKGEWDPEPTLNGRYMKYTTAPKQLMLIAQLEYTCADGTTTKVVSDTTWKTSVSGPRIESSWYGGEQYDARLEIANWSSPVGNISSWSTANTTTPPPGTLVGPQFPPLQIVDSFPAANVSGPIGGQYVFDFGTNFAGWYALMINETAGVQVTMWPSERLKSSGAIDQSTTGSPIWDGFVSNGEVTYFSPKFMYHGFRYLGVNLTYAPATSDATALVIRTASEAISTVETSDSMLNSIHKIIDRAIQSNLYSVMTDCPHREKFGWLEQTHLVFDPVTRNYDIEAYGKGIVKSINDSLVSTGLIPDIAPEYTVFSGGYRDDPNWGNAMILVPQLLYNNYGDVDLLTDYYGTMQIYLNYLSSRSTNYLLSYGLGDWISFDTSTPVGITATYGYAVATSAMISISSALGKTSDAATYTSLLDNILTAFHEKYFNSTNTSYGSNSQASNALALDMGAVPTEYQTAVLNNIIQSIENNGSHLTVGEIALPSLIRSLQKLGADDTVYAIATNPTSPSYAYQVLHGATSLTERWDGPTASCSGCNSLNHFMLGYIDRWITQLSGVAQSNTSALWDTVEFSPIMLTNLTSAASTFRSPKGMISAEWALEGSTMTYNITVPIGATGIVTLAYGYVTESGKNVTEPVDGLSVVSQSSNQTVLTVESGAYSFVAAQ